ncbi:MAG: hypothetical protein ABSH20_21090 [Tepidisphaeraceae bacterium]|jgi:hypothetical protein
MMSLELETLDQFRGGDMSLRVIHSLFPDDQQFAKAIQAMLLNQDIRLLAHDGSEVPQWRWRQLFVAA